MPRESKRDKAVRYFAEDRIRVQSANGWGMRYTVRGSAPEPYRCAYGTDERGRLITECTCSNADVHPVHPTCCHIEIGKMLRGDVA